jgi:hypothetical protein
VDKVFSFGAAKTARRSTSPLEAMLAARPSVVARFVAVALLIATVALGGCTQGKPPFLMVQLCLRNDQQLADFTHFLQSIAYSEGMTYIDRSGPTEREFAALNRPNTAPVINIGLEGSDGVGLGVGNLGLPKYQVAVGFSEGSKPVEARRLAEMVVGQLKARWHVETVPEGRGALPIPNCLAHPETQ